MNDEVFIAMAKALNFIDVSSIAYQAVFDHWHHDLGRQAGQPAALSLM